MIRPLYMAIGLVCYTAFFIAFVYLIGFVAGYPALPTHVAKGLSAAPAVAAAIDMGLIALFGLQHSVMARPGFKAAWTRIVPAPIERSVYCLAAALALGVMFALWHPIAGTVWSVGNPTGRVILWTLFGLGWLIVFISTHLISHWELFGLAQPWRHLRGTEPPPADFRTPGFYRLVRHPIYAGFFIAMWATPEMSLGHLLLAVGLSIYMLIGIRYEERDLVGHFGPAYEDYRGKVGMLVPGIGRRKQA